jgi:hypothetical protein
MSASLDLSPDLERYRLPPEDFNDLAALDGQPSRREASVEPQIAQIVREFNDDVAYALRHRTGAVRESRENLVPEQEAASLPPHPRLILDRYAVVDALALYYRDRTRKTFMWLLGAAFLAMLIFEAFAHFLVDFLHAGAWPRLVFWFYPIFWVGAWLLWFHAHRRKYQKKYNDYRALAEGLRVQFFWNVLGLPDSVEENYLKKQQGELDWIRRAIRWWDGHDQKVVAASPPSVEQLKDRKSLVRRRWVQAQYHYFAEVAGPREELKGRHCKKWGAMLFWTSLALSVAVGAWEVVNVLRPIAERGQPAVHHMGPNPIEQALFIAISMLLVGAAIMVAYGEKMAFSEHTRQYWGTSMLFRKADAQLTDGNLTLAETELFRTLGKEALQENGDWLLLHRDRPLEIIVP